MAYINKVNVDHNSDQIASADLLAIGVFEDKSLTDLGRSFDDAGDGVLSKAMDLGDVKGQTGETNMFYINGQRILLLSLIHI